MLKQIIKIYDRKTIYLNDKEQIHRDDGPAIIWVDGSKWYYINGLRHREDGPAVIWGDGRVEYYLNDKKLTKEEFENRNKTELTLKEIADKFNVDVKDLRIKE